MKNRKNNATEKHGENEHTECIMAHKVGVHTSPKIPTGHASTAAPISLLRNDKPIYR